MAGPWFTVRQSGADFAKLGELWISNGKTSERAVFEYKVRFDDVAEDVEPIFVPTSTHASLLTTEGRTP